MDNHGVKLISPHMTEITKIVLGSPNWSFTPSLKNLSLGNCLLCSGASLKLSPFFGQVVLSCCHSSPVSIFLTLWAHAHAACLTIDATGNTTFLCHPVEVTFACPLLECVLQTHMVQIPQLILRQNHAGGLWKNLSHDQTDWAMHRACVCSRTSGGHWNQPIKIPQTNSMILLHCFTMGFSNDHVTKTW